MQIRFNNLKIDEIKNSSGVFTGDNYQSNWSHYSKKNEGLGSLSGDQNISIGNRSILNDEDHADTTPQSNWV